MVRNFLLFFSLLFASSLMAENWVEVITEKGSRRYLASPDNLVVEYKVFSPLMVEAAEQIKVYGDGRAVRTLPQVYKDHGDFQRRLTRKEMANLIVELESSSDATDQSTTSGETMRFFDLPRIHLRMRFLGGGNNQIQTVEPPIPATDPMHVMKKMTEFTGTGGWRKLP